MDNIEELKHQLELLETRDFMLNMCDRWDDGDYRYSWELHKQIQELKKKIKELEENGKVE